MGFIDFFVKDSKASDNDSGFLNTYIILYLSTIYKKNEPKNPITHNIGIDGANITHKAKWLMKKLYLSYILNSDPLYNSFNSSWVDIKNDAQQSI